jgi:hypothetical protein
LKFDMLVHKMVNIKVASRSSIPSLSASATIQIYRSIEERLIATSSPLLGSVLL